MTDLHGNEPLKFSFWAADNLKSAFTNAATDVEGQTASRAAAVTTGSQEFAGLFADLFKENADTAAVGASGLCQTLREAADFVDQIMESAKRENARRREAREYYERLEARSGWDKFIDGFDGVEQPPTTKKEDQLVLSSTYVPPAREVPTGGGSAGPTSSALPANLRSFSSTTTALDGELASRPGTLTAALDTFATQCDWGSFTADGLVRALSDWLGANANDAAWATTVADKFAQAGGEGSVSTLSNAAIAASLQASGIALGRDDLLIEPTQAFGGAPTSGYSVDPVNTTTGNFLETEVDLAFSGANSTLRLSRMYNSLDPHVGLFGPGWASVLETRLTLDDEGAAFTMADGRQVLFPRLGEGWDRGVGENFWLAAEGSTLVVRDNAGSRWRFTPSGLWLGSEGGAGTAVEVARHPDGLPARLTHARGRWIEIDYVDGRVAVATGSDGRRVEYAYDDAGRLVGATSEVGTRRYGWNDAGLIEKVTSASGVVEAVNTYDDRGRVVEQLTPHGRTVRFAYLRGRVTVVSDTDGSRSNTWISDAKGRLVGVLDTDDHRQSMSYDPHGNLVSVVERDGSTTVHGYDDRGRKVRTVTASGADLTWGYDDLDRVTTLVTESGSVVQYEYDGDDRDPSVIVDPEGGRSELIWRDGLLERVVDPTGVTVVCVYDAFGDLVATTNAVGDVARIERDHTGRPVVATSPSGARTTFTYDAAGLLTARRDPDGATWRFEHGPGARVTAVVDPLGARTEYGYGPHGELETTTDPLGRVVSRRFDDQGNLSAIVLPDGGENRFGWDALSRLRTVTDPAGHDWTREYDVTGALTATVDPTGVRQEARVDQADGTGTLRDAFTTTTVRFDEYGRPVATEAPDGSAELTTYDRCGRVVELVDGEGGLTRLERDLAGRVTAVVTPTGARTTYEYDACGRAAASTDPLGARTTLTYDADSRVVARTLPTGEVERIDHDAAGRIVARRVPGQGTARFGYDAAGRLTSTQDTRYGQRRFRYDAAGQLVEAVNGLGGVTRYEYDLRGRVVAITDPLGSVTRREYDAADRVTSVVDPLGRTTTAEYDAAGRQLRQRDPDGHVTEWLHDAAGRPATTSVDGRETSTVSVDPVTRAITVTDHTNGAGHDVEHRLEYDRRGGLVRRSRGDSAIAWEYDADGRRTARVDPDGTRTEYRRDLAGRVVSIVHAGVESTVSYDASGRIVASTGGDLLQAWSYDDGALAEHTTTGVDGATTTTITRDASARIARIDGPSGTVEYGYDDACQLTTLRTGSGGLATWTYDLAGRLVAETHDGVTTTSTHDAAGQITSRDLADGRRVEYVHDGLGRRVREIADDGTYTEYAWSALGWLTDITRRDADARVVERTSLWVDALGELATVDGADVWWDSASPLPSLVSLGGSSVTTLPGGATRVGEDWLASAWRGAHATDATDPWGADRASSTAGPELPGGMTLTATGGLQVAGLDWLGARVYDPTARGFLSVDPLAPVTGAAWAGNPYSYAGNDPLHALDPLGLRPATDADLADYAKATQGAWANAGDWWDDNWEYVVAGAAIVGGVALMATGVGGPAGIALMAASGALLSGGISVASQKATTGEVDWSKAGTDALIGGVLGGASAGASAFASAFGGRAASLLSSGASRAGSALTNAGGRVGSAMANAGQKAFSATTRAVTSQIGRNTISNAVVGGAGNVGTYYVTTPQSEWDLTDAGGSFVGGFVSGGLTANAGAAADALPAAMSALRPVVRYGIGSLGSAGGGLAERGITGDDYSVADIGFDVVGGSVMTHFPGAAELGATNVAAHVGTAWAGQHASWMMDGTQFVLEQTGALP
ncbi:DUF6531 domain-containing protein [Frigoribacterium sp. MCBA15_019]|uniref:DUF6531 domain-containing protein n=1 Tax=unclassified Frigoribacterium TaxID=2627005 RepID=UPI0008DCB0EC|nr:DUF6531 domain-containing protein [Frigoribacterium sp. MCBA15_019]OII23818.1 hypothetical protein BIV04_07025 [Frigoribacterium sp. MCBA15_019]